MGKTFHTLSLASTVFTENYMNDDCDWHLAHLFIKLEIGTWFSTNGTTIKSIQSNVFLPGTTLISPRFMSSIIYCIMKPDTFQTINFYQVNENAKLYAYNTCDWPQLSIRLTIEFTIFIESRSRYILFSKFVTRFHCMRRVNTAVK